MPFRRPRNLVNSEKHEITFSQLAADIGTATLKVDLADGVALGDLDAADEVGVGHKISNIFMEINVAAQTTTNPKILHWAIIFDASSAGIIGNPSVYNPAGKKFIIKRGMEMLPSDVATVFKRILVINVPKKYRRIGDADKIQFQARCTSTETINICGFFIYKEYS